MAKKNNDKNDIILTQGLLIGDDATRMINISSQNDLLYLDVTLYCPELIHDPHNIFDTKFLAQMDRHPQKTPSLYQDALRGMFGENLADMGFQKDVLQNGLKLSFVSHKDMREEKDFFGNPRMPELLDVTSVKARIEQQFSLEEAHDYSSDIRDPRLDQLLSFIHGHDIIPPNKGRKSYGARYNYQTILAGIGNMTQSACSSFVFQNKIEAINRIRREDYDATSFATAYNFINTNTALQHKVSKKCRTFVDVKAHDSAIMNNLALNHFAQNNNSLFTTRQTRSLAKIYHRQSVNNNYRFNQYRN